MIVQKTVTLSRKDLLELINRQPGLGKVTEITTFPVISAGILHEPSFGIRCSWVDDEVLPGIEKEAK